MRKVLPLPFLTHLNPAIANKKPTVTCLFFTSFMVAIFSQEREWMIFYCSDNDSLSTRDVNQTTIIIPLNTEQITFLL